MADAHVLQGAAARKGAAPKVPTLSMAGLPIAILDMEETARLMVEAARVRPRPGRPLYCTSANGEVISRAHLDPGVARLFHDADIINADGQAMVTFSRLLARDRLPERVATTDLFHVVARMAAEKGLSFYFFGATEEENRRTVENVRARYPALRIAGRSHGYLAGPALAAKLDEIDALAPDILWLALGVPREQAFVHDFADRLAHVGVIKTSGGLFNFLSGTRARAPLWLQKAGLEWSWRLLQEPRRLFWRYALTSPHAAYLMLTRTRAE